MKKILIEVLALMCLAAVCSEEGNANPGAAQGSPPEKGFPGAMFYRGQDKDIKLFLPLKQTDVEMQITHGFYKCTIRQTFKNETEYNLEAVYVFPLPADATVNDMTLQVGDIKIKSVIKEKQEAKAVYEEAKKEGKKTALLEQERPNIFTTSVANFAPGETVTVEFSYNSSLTFKNGSYDLIFPMVVGPRYIPFEREASEDGTEKATTKVSVFEKITPPLLHPSIDPGHRLSLKAEIFGIPVSKIDSGSHGIIVDKLGKYGDSRTVSLKDTEVVPDQDLQLKIQISREKSPEISFSSFNDAGSNYGMLNFFPPLAEETESNLPKDIIFVIDTSGSMSGESIRQASEGLIKCLPMLNKDDRFTVVRFSDYYSVFSEILCDVSQSNLDAAKDYITKLKADGGTEMLPALEHALKMNMRYDALKIIVLMTDGCVGNEESLMCLVKGKIGDRRLFTFGIGSAPNEYLMRKIAECGRGGTEFIHSTNEITGKISDFFATISSPVVTDISVSWLDPAGMEMQGVVAYPNPCPDLFREKPMQIFLKFADFAPSKIVVTGKRGSENVRFEKEIGFAENAGDPQEYEAVKFLFGGALLNDLMTKYILEQSDETKENLKKEIIKSSIEFGIVSNFTSRVAVEEKVTQNSDGTECVTVNVPVTLPKGWNEKAFFQGATNDPELLLYGVVMMLVSFAGILISLKKIRKAA